MFKAGKLFISETGWRSSMNVWLALPVCLPTNQTLLYFTGQWWHNLHIMHLLSMTAMDLLGKLYLFEVVPENQFWIDKRQYCWAGGRKPITQAFILPHSSGTGRMFYFFLNPHIFGIGCIDMGVIQHWSAINLHRFARWHDSHFSFAKQYIIVPAAKTKKYDIFSLSLAKKFAESKGIVVK